MFLWLISPCYSCEEAEETLLPAVGSNKVIVPPTPARKRKPANSTSSVASTPKTAKIRSVIQLLLWIFYSLENSAVGYQLWSSLALWFLVGKNDQKCLLNMRRWWWKKGVVYYIMTVVRIIIVWKFQIRFDLNLMESHFNPRSNWPQHFWLFKNCLERATWNFHVGWWYNTTTSPYHFWSSLVLESVGFVVNYYSQSEIFHSQVQILTCILSVTEITAILSISELGLQRRLIHQPPRRRLRPRSRQPRRKRKALRV